ncbi:MAG TPA: MarR family transcriptional regulator [Solirubrobacterales bacterium]|nr:MarR family transcriptional regulator [Solirubrobacterales bacterium]
MARREFGSPLPEGVRAESPTAYMFVALAKQLRGEFEARLAPLGIHAGQDRLLQELWQEDGMTQRELIDRLSVEPPTVTGILQRLEREGFLTRRPDEENRRIQRVYLTDAGRKLEGPVREVWREVESSFLSGLSSADRRQLQSLLVRLVGS